MYCVIVGKKPVDYISKKTGNPVNGISLFIEREPTARETTVEGLVTDSIFISSTSSAFQSLPDIIPGDFYNLIYESDGRYSFLSKVVPVSDTDDVEFVPALDKYADVEE